MLELHRKFIFSFFLVVDNIANDAVVKVLSTRNEVNLGKRGGSLIGIGGGKYHLRQILVVTYTNPTDASGILNDAKVDVLST